MQSYENFYPGLFFVGDMPETSHSDLFVGYRIPVSKLGAGASAVTVNQITEVWKRLNTGMKIVEAGTISPETFEKIPKQHFKEINRLAKLAGAEITWHASIVDPAGAGEGKISEELRKQNEQILWNQIERVYEATGGKQPITIHASAATPADILEEGIIGVANTIDGSIGSLKLESKLTPEEIIEGKKPEMINPKEFLNEKNKEIWRSMIERIELRKTDIEDFIMKYPEEQINIIIDKKKTLKDSYAYRYFGKHLDELSVNEKNELDNILNKNSEARQLFNTLEKIEAKAKESKLLFEDLIEDVENAWRTAFKASKEVRDEYGLKKLEEIARDIVDLKKQPKETAIVKLTNVLNNMRELTPKILVNSEDFAKDKAAETLSNLAVKSFKKFKENAPIISVENIFPGMAFSTAESLKSLIEETRNKFVEKMKKEVGEKKARELAERLIGVTWDIGHINIWQKYGKKPEDIVAETKAIKPFIKHLHITDNFGFTDSHLPPGMGEVPKEVFKEIKELTEKGVKGVLEVPTLALPEPSGFGVNPYTYSLAALGSPIYTYEMAPFWNEVLFRELPAYFTGYGPILPERHFEIYGASFSGLPAELGGIAAKKGFAEVPME